MSLFEESGAGFVKPATSQEKDITILVVSKLNTWLRTYRVLT